MTWWNARSKRTQAILVIMGLLVLAAITSPKSPAGGTAIASTAPAATSAQSAVATAASTTAVPTAPPAATPTPVPTAFNFGSGKKLVGSEVPAGTYRTRTASAGCYWERLSGLGGTLGEILANGNPAGPEVVTIASADVAFNSARCAPWSVDLTAITPTTTAPFGAGTFIVGVDVAPGTWRSAGGSSCYWQRMNAFTGTSRDIIANDNAGESTLVAIGPNDKGFSSMRCGTWTKIG